MADAKKYLDLAGLQSYHSKLKSEYLVDKIPNVINASSQVINTTVLSGTPTAPTSPEGSTLANTDVIASTKWVLNQISGITEPMIYKGGATATVTGTEQSHTVIYDYTLATGDTLATGYTFKVTAVTNTGSLVADDIPKAGDTIIATVASGSTTWTIIPSGDETGTINTITTSGDGAAAITVTGNNTPTVDLAINAATGGAFGVVKTGANITNTNGVISVETGSKGGKGVLQVGDNIDVTDAGVISVAIASDTALGLVKVDTANGISLDANNKLKVNVDGTIVTNTNGTISVAAATSATKGVVSVPAVGGLTVDGNGAIGVNNGNTINKDSTLGTLNVNIDGTTLQADGSTGVISARTANGTTSGIVSQGTNVTIGNDGAVNVATAAGGTLGVATVAADTSGGLNIADGVISVNPIATSDINALFPQS